MASSGASPLFAKLLEEALQAIEWDHEATELRREADALLGEMRTWETTAPDGTRRSKVIASVFDLHRRARERATRR